MARRLTLPAESVDWPALREFLMACGARFAGEPDSARELFRFDSAAGAGLACCNASKGRVTLYGRALCESFERFAARLEPRPFVKAWQASEPGGIHLFTDAGHHAQTQSGAWAAILLDRDGMRHQAAAPLEGLVRSSTQAEVAAVACALYRFGKAGRLARGDLATIVNDNAAVVTAIARGHFGKARCPDSAAALDRVFTLAERLGVTIAAQWIKGHQPADSGDWRAPHNRAADRLASRHARQLYLARLG